MWNKKPLKIYGGRMSESMLAILSHIIKGEIIIQVKLRICFGYSKSVHAVMTEILVKALKLKNPGFSRYCIALYICGLNIWEIQIDLKLSRIKPLHARWLVYAVIKLCKQTDFI